jgi:hypothetical protein
VKGALTRSVLSDEGGHKADHRETTIPDFCLGSEAKFPSIAIGDCSLSCYFISGLHGVYSRTRLFELMLTNITKSVKVLLMWNIRTGWGGCRHCCMLDDRAALANNRLLAMRGRSEPVIMVNIAVCNEPRCLFPNLESLV